MRRTILIAAAVIAVSVVLLYLLLGAIMPDLGGTEMSGHGVAAMVLGVVLTLVVGIGLMALVFFSHRHGYDEQVGEGVDELPERDDR